MERCIALLRGINVGGVKLTNAQLVSTFATLGFANVRAVLASGNVAFDAQQPSATDAERLTLARHIESAFSQKFRYEARLVLVTQDRLRSVAELYPFEREDALQHPYVVFSSSPEALSTLLNASEELPRDIESVAMGAGVMYWRVPKGSSLDTPFAKILARKDLAPHLTTRNLRSVQKLVSA